jgi:RNA-directed DNA polymerase
MFIGASPSKKNVQRLKDKVGAILVPGNKGAWGEVRDTLNRLLRGWCGYFSPGSHYTTDREIEAHLYDRTRNFLARRHKLPTRGSRQIRMAAVFGPMGVLRPRMGRDPDATS